MLSGLIFGLMHIINLWSFDNQTIKGVLNQVYATACFGIMYGITTLQRRVGRYVANLNEHWTLARIEKDCILIRALDYWFVLGNHLTPSVFRPLGMQYSALFSIQLRAQPVLLKSANVRCVCTYGWSRCRDPLSRRPGNDPDPRQQAKAQRSPDSARNTRHPISSSFRKFLPPQTWTKWSKRSSGALFYCWPSRFSTSCLHENFKAVTLYCMCLLTRASLFAAWMTVMNVWFAP